MCGIAGIVSRDGAPIDGAQAVASVLDRALAHRGPDGSGVWHSAGRDVLLVHRRLAIIDVSDAARQPMATADGRCTVTFNGEVYNHRELRRELEARGERFATASDTEVLLRLVALDGAAALARVRGMFAFACWDNAARTLLLARDRYGIKPLYIASGAAAAAGASAPGRGRAIAFASELHALRAAGLIDTRPSPDAVLAFLAWGSVPAPLAWHAGVEMLEPGTWYEWRQDGGERRGRFADAREPYRSAASADAGDLRARAGAAVRDSVRAHLVSDVPVGIFLSGGLDSSAVVSAACSSGATQLKTFTVTFDHPTSEAAYARQVADAFGTAHHELRVDAANIAGDVPAILARLDQPSIDAVNSYYVSRAVASTGTKAVLSGVGGDELFGGYPSFRRIPAALAIKRAAGPAFRVVAPAIAPVLPGRLKARWAHFASTNGDARDAYRTQRGFLMPDEIRALAGPALADRSTWSEAWQRLAALDGARLAPTGPETTAAGVARMEVSHYLGSQLLRDIDVMSMAHGLEVRVPFVDHELTSAVWPDLGRHPTLMRGKRLLGDTLQRPLPAAVTSRSKQGFILPFDGWMRGTLAPFVRSGLDQLASAGWIAKDAPLRVWSDWETGRAHWTRPWGLAVLGAMAGEAR